MQSVLLLQGPLGPFFQHLSHFLNDKGIRVHKIHFNGGDKCWPCAGTQVDYTGSLPEWRHYLSEYINTHAIDTLFCYSDCREYHAVAREFCLAHKIRFFAFEEGYLRPHYITLEQNGVNAHSTWFGKLAEQLPNGSTEHVKHKLDIKPNFKRRIFYAMRYYLNLQLGRPQFRRYVHHRHRPYWQEGLAWLKGWYTKYTHIAKDKALQQQLIDHHSGHIHLVPLQVADDFQIRTHSHFSDVSESITHIIDSFAAHAPKDDILLLKHHPMDRGYTHYREQINKQATELGVNQRVFYGFELSLPDLYRHCKGVVTVNSTVGLSALFHHVPTITLGKALYDILGLTTQGSLANYWRSPAPVDVILFKQLRAFLLQHTQLNGSFYCEPQSTCNYIWQHLEQKAVPAIKVQPQLIPASATRLVSMDNQDKNVA
ncbi:capsular polysaccharide biosynthesis protein [Oceanisphaera marina]|uniref:Capsular polysaccharide biosynthesis protein n=1 Tax=Oceanisphaera marina TaxID=2017550 RepID=A0ABQ1IMU2_9GAMM|nr:capsular biosynthesis protein [Oceanisphaera marina]GGB46316.1 capsular polysaccharide biosynthesis protein [Oceanisphaera marina]